MTYIKATWIACDYEDMFPIIAFHKWMLQNDTEQNAEKYFHYSDNDMWNEFLNSK